MGNYEKAINDFLEVQRFDKTFANVDCQLKRISKYVLFSKNSKKTDEKFEQKGSSLSLNRINLEDFEKSSIKNFIYCGVDDFCSPLKDYLSVNSLKKERFTNKTKLNKEKKYSKLLNYHLKDFNDFYSFAEIIKNIPTRRQKRSFQELTNLINFIQEKKINLYLIKNDNEKFLGSYCKNSNSIVINAAYPFDLDLMCSTLTHELIHYFQFKKGNHLGLEIADETVKLCRLEAKEKLITDFEFRIELEANTYDGVKDFIFNYSKNKSKTIKKYSITEKRDKTIDWVCKSKMLPIYFESSNPKKVIDFSSQTK